MSVSSAIVALNTASLPLSRGEAGFLFSVAATEYTKPFKTVAEQYELLASRGMAITDDETVKRWLESVRYYRLSGYRHPFRIRRRPEGSAPPQRLCSPLAAVEPQHRRPALPPTPGSDTRASPCRVPGRHQTPLSLDRRTGISAETTAVRIELGHHHHRPHPVRARTDRPNRQRNRVPRRVGKRIRLGHRPHTVSAPAIFRFGQKSFIVTAPSTETDSNERRPPLIVRRRYAPTSQPNVISIIGRKL